MHWACAQVSLGREYGESEGKTLQIRELSSRQTWVSAVTLEHRKLKELREPARSRNAGREPRRAGTRRGEETDQQLCKHATPREDSRS